MKEQPEQYFSRYAVLEETALEMPMSAVEYKKYVRKDYLPERGAGMIFIQLNAKDRYHNRTSPGAYRSTCWPPTWTSARNI